MYKDSFFILFYFFILYEGKRYISIILNNGNIIFLQCILYNMKT